MTVFRSDREADPMPAANEQIAGQGCVLRTKAIFTGQDAGLSQSIADLRKGYADATKIQSDGDREAAIHLANVNAQIDANVPAMGCEFIGHPPDQYEAGDSSKIPSSDPAWTIPTAKLRENLELTQALYGQNGALNKLLETRSPRDAQHAMELEDHLRRSMGETGPTLQPIEQPARQVWPETFPDGSLYQISDLADGQVQLKLITGEVFSGDARTVAQKIAESKVHTTRWGQEWKQKAQQQQPWEGPPSAILPASGVQDDEYGAPVMEVGQTVVPDNTYINLHNMATALGYNDINQLIADQMNLRAQTEQIGQELRADREERQNKECAAVFMAQHPDFPSSPEASEALCGIIDQNGMEYTPQALAIAHDHAIRTGVYQPLSREEQQLAMGIAPQVARPTPPPMLRGSNPESGWQGENDPYRVPLDDLRKQAIRQQLEGSTPSLAYR